MYQLYFTQDAKKDFHKISKSNLKQKILTMLELIKSSPWQDPPPLKKLRGPYLGAYSRRINIQHRLYYQIDEDNKRVKILRMWTHYGDN